MTPWTCGECDAHNPSSAEARFCRACGSPRNPSVSSRPDAPEVPECWRPGFRVSKPEDRCTAPGCDTTVRDHIEEFRAIVTRPNTMFTRVSQRVSVEDKLRALEALRRAPDEVPF